MMFLAQLTIDQWVTWGLQGLIIFAGMCVWKQLESNTKSVNELRLDMTKDYVTITEWRALRERVHDINDWVSGEKAKESLLNLRHRQKDCDVS